MTDEALAQVIAGAKKLIQSVEFDVNGVNGKGGNEGLTSNQTLQTAGELRIIVSRYEKTHP